MQWPSLFWKQRGSVRKNFARSHPGGALGRRLLIRVSDVMHTDNRLPVVAPDTPLVDVLYEISSKGMGMAAIVDPTGALLGIYTDGDLRRTLQKGADIRDLTAKEVMKTKPHNAFQPERLASEAVKIHAGSQGSTACSVVDAESRLGGCPQYADLFVRGCSLI